MRDFSQRGFKKMLEAEEGIEPSNTGFANPRLTTWLLRLRWANL